MATAQTSVSLSSHSDLITSLAFSSHPYLATSSLDHTIRVSSLNPATGTWDLDAQDWKAHDSPVLKVTWAHPEFGAVLASGGVDGIVKIWVQEDVRAPATAARTRGGAATTGGPSTTTGPEKRWVQRAALTDARGTIRDIEFAPPDFGLKLAAVSSDSHLRLWECLDPVSMLEWTLVEDIDLGNLPVQPSSATSAGLGAGGLQGQQGGPSPSLTVPADNVASPAKGGSGPSSSGLGPTSLGSAGGSSNVGSLGSSASGSSFDGRRGGTVESDGGWALSWCKEAWWGERLAVSGGNSGIIRVSMCTCSKLSHQSLTCARSDSSSTFQITRRGQTTSTCSLLAPRPPPTPPRRRLRPSRGRPLRDGRISCSLRVRATVVHACGRSIRQSWKTTVQTSGAQRWTPS